ncbi:hypothetical protein F8O01_00685 [Pseudoclavibacter chungangensis]|uniref:Alpha/beta hydrolase n=1 Tax=Pseudoclavibacter chungangensis TaxID=587635 RepID=A0A7J5C1I3_9MICO|nr:hypothetical protein [Pseudoclavibacter chungangensis]KAB1662497.1 hypothetical protein F8O01_00685 [Pseudoclavibacter chungangensis]NYJ68535.1 hypothetical protein [Pseudoclavibacter chungangensis]
MIRDEAIRPTGRTPHAFSHAAFSRFARRAALLALVALHATCLAAAAPTAANADDALAPSTHAEPHDAAPPVSGPAEDTPDPVAECDEYVTDEQAVGLAAGLHLLDRLVHEVLECSTPDESASTPDVQSLILDRPPAATLVKRWWHDVARTRLAHLLVTHAPLVIGNLAGIPFETRIAANAITASDELDDVESTVVETIRVDADAIELPHLRAEARYLRGVVTGEVRLASYRPDRDEIVQVFAPRGSEVRTTIIYTPGTYATPDGMYDGSIQEVGRWLAERDAHVAVFVWLGGRFPGAAGAADPEDALRGLVEAADPQLALATGRALAAFQQGVFADPLLADTRQIAIGHSWGLAATTGAELAGARFEQVHSLAGAYTAPGWTPVPGTLYRHWTYDDFVSMFQKLGLLSSTGGEIPTEEPAFRSTMFRTPEADTDVGTSADLATTIRDLADRPTSNHDLIASSKRSNAIALDAIRTVIG